MALNGANGYLYLTTLGTATTSNGLTKESWYRIAGKSSTGGLPTNLSTGDIFYQRTSISPVPAVAMTSNDAVQKLGFTKLAFITNFSESISKEKFDETVQTDDVKSYQVSSKPEKTITIDGYWIDNDAKQQLLLKKLDTVVEQTSSNAITRTSPQTTCDYFMLSRDETTASNAQVWAWLPTIIESLNSDKPMEGVQNFSLSGTVKGSERPNTYILDN
jgi:hypothetical protein